MAEDAPWLTIVGLGEDGLNGLSDASRDALERADVVMGAARHLALVPDPGCEIVEWPVPFADGVALLLAQRGRRVVMLVSGDPFWFGAGTSVTRQLARSEWVALPAPSSFSWAAAQLGWPLEKLACLGLHAAPLTRLRPHLVGGARVLVLLRDGAAVGELARYLCAMGFGESHLHVMEALGGARARVRHVMAAQFDLDDVAHPVIAGVEVAGQGAVVPVVAGRPDALFAHDGQITKRAMRALTLSALAPRAGELLWDIGAGAGSVGIEWLLAHPSLRAIGFEGDARRAARARANAHALGVDRLVVVEGRAPQVLEGQPLPAAVFIGGGICATMLEQLWDMLPQGVRVVANAVTLESEALLAQWHARAGGGLLRLDMAEAAALGTRRGWRAGYPVVQWSVTR
ncbi:precorrin-6y C5,15-methyltransferase (decarboxylating) subunit CbiE [Roseinatronobacter sp. NSM]|uniref:precorrin-6y C5,15-methyltransferase (decarboxylating) subunit CbiE n=1 Tax=Roseinatronobacter sp. NSM TaxID=3457785 RepID=UPI004036426C